MNADRFGSRRFSLDVSPIPLEEVRAVAQRVTSRDDPEQHCLSIDQAAELLDRPRLTIQRWIKSGRLTTHGIPGARAREPKQYVIEKDLLEAAKSAQGDRGRPKKTRDQKWI